MPPVMIDSRLYKQLAVLVLCVHYSALDKRKHPKTWTICPSAHHNAIATSATTMLLLGILCHVSPPDWD